MYCVFTESVIIPKKTLEENGTFLNGTMKQLLENAKAGVQDIWENGEHTLWTAKNIPLCPEKKEMHKRHLWFYCVLWMEQQQKRKF